MGKVVYITGGITKDIMGVDPVPEDPQAHSLSPRGRGAYLLRLWWGAPDFEVM